MSNFWKRFFTSVVLVVVFVGSVIYSLYNFMFLVLLINLIGLYEFYRMFALRSPVQNGGLFLSFLMFITSALALTGFSGISILLLNIPVAFIFFLSELYSLSEKPFEELALTFLGIIFVTIPCILLMALALYFPHSGRYSPEIILGFIVIVWTYDTGAYFLGKMLGKHALFKRVSPHKTWEGLVGGALCAFSAAMLIAGLYNMIALVHWLVTALLVVVFGTYGDLIKSRLKRSRHKKDSGGILPGHGGILDRFDSMLGSAPFVLIYFLLAKYVQN